MLDDKNCQMTLMFFICACLALHWFLNVCGKHRLTYMGCEKSSTVCGRAPHITWVHIFCGYQWVVLKTPVGWWFVWLLYHPIYIYIHRGFSSSTDGIPINQYDRITLPNWLLIEHCNYSIWNVWTYSTGTDTTKNVDLMISLGISWRYHGGFSWGYTLWLKTNDCFEHCTTDVSTHLLPGSCLTARPELAQLDGEEVGGRRLPRFVDGWKNPAISCYIIGLIQGKKYRKVRHYVYIYIYILIIYVYMSRDPHTPAPSQMVPPPLWQGRGGFLSSQAMVYVVFIVHIVHMYR